MFLAAARLLPWLPATALALMACCGPIAAAAEDPASDLQTVEFTLKVQPHIDDSGEALPITATQLERAGKIIAKRVVACTPNKASVTLRKPNTVFVSIPSLTREKTKEIRSVLEMIGRLELREVHPRTDETAADGKTLAQRVAEGQEIVPGYRAYTLKRTDSDGIESQRHFLLNRRIAIGNTDVRRAFPSPAQPDAVAVVLSAGGTQKIIALTTPMQAGRDRIGIVLDGKLLSAPVVNATPLGKNFIIEGLTEPGEAQMLANALMTPLENPLKIVEERSISDSLKHPAKDPLQKPSKP